jgi:hypothetical protein
MTENNGTRTSLTPPKEGINASVGREMGRDWGWVLARTRRVERLLAEPAVMELADELVRHCERFCAHEAIDMKDLQVDILPTRSKSYITLQLSP